jgi:uncharacterized delta-60 repeat protein
VKLGYALAACAAAVLSVTTLASAGGGDLDPSFSGDGWVRSYDVTGYTGPYFAKSAEDLAIQPDGKIVAVGEVQDGDSRHYFGVLRWTADGRLDRSFGNGGLSVTDVGVFEIAHAVALQRDGKLVVAGDAVGLEGACDLTTCIVVARYGRDGSLDRSFGTAGVVHTGTFGCGCVANDVAIQPDGKIVVAGWRFRYGPSDESKAFAVNRYLPDGRLDPSFSRDGLATISVDRGLDAGYAVALQPDGRIVVAGQNGKSFGTMEDFGLIRLRRNGTLDRTFSRNGRQTVNFGKARRDMAVALAVQRDGRVIVVGVSRATPISTPSIAIARLRRNGRLDRSFGSRGRRLTVPVPNGGDGRAVAVQPDGRILVAGQALEHRNQNAASWLLVRYTNRGTMDRSFGRGGVVVSDFGTGIDSAEAIMLQADGRILVGGEVYMDHAIARYR